MPSCVLLTNDDGVDSEGMLKLAGALIDSGENVLIFAPAKNHSACGMALTLGKPLKVRKREDIESRFNLDKVRVWELAGTPSDCMIAGIDGGLENIEPGWTPKLCVSGINVGPNVSIDVFHSGTIAAAREASLYGLPSIACSLSDFNLKGIEGAVSASIEVINKLLRILPDIPENIMRPSGASIEEYHSNWPHDSRKNTGNPDDLLRKSFINGDLFINLNIPPEWNGNFSLSRLGVRWYKGALQIKETEEGCEFSIGGVRIVEENIEDADVLAISTGKASLTCLATWPQGHPLNLDQNLLAKIIQSNISTLPDWLI